MWLRIIGPGDPNNWHDIKNVFVRDTGHNYELVKQTYFNSVEDKIEVIREVVGWVSYSNTILSVDHIKESLECISPKNDEKR